MVAYRADGHGRAARDPASMVALLLYTYCQVARKVLEGAAEIDEQENELYGEKRGDQLPATLARREERRAWLREAPV